MMRSIAIVIFTCACALSQAQVNIITTIAGTGNAGYSGDGGPAINADFNRPHTIFLHGTDNLLVCDVANHVVRKLNLALGVVTTIAGTGVGSFSGDSGLATNANLCAPQGICFDIEDNIYIDDGVNNRIRKIDNGTGIITTIAGTGVDGASGDGGLAVNAQIQDPVGLFYFRPLLYVADYSNNKIRRINLVTGIISTVAGTGFAGFSGDGGSATNAQLNGPIDVVCDLLGNLFIADQWNGAVRRVDAISGIITTVVGTGTLGYSGDNGPATNAQLNEPGGMFIDNYGNLYISDYRNGAIRKVHAATGIIVTVAGGIAGYGGDGGPATNAKLKCTDVWVDENENIYIADYVNDRIRRVNSGVAVSGVDKEIESKLYPNPTKGIFTIQTPVNIALVSVYNIAGMQVYQRTCTTTETEIDLSEQPPGVYMVYVQCGDKKYVSKISVFR